MKFVTSRTLRMRGPRKRGDERVAAAGRTSIAQRSASAPAAAQLKRVEITATRSSDTQERRESAAAKIVLGREEIDRYGDSKLGDVLTACTRPSACSGAASKASRNVQFRLEIKL